MQCDRMAADCGYELRKHNVAFLRMSPGTVNTDTNKQNKDSGHFDNHKSVSI